MLYSAMLTSPLADQDLSGHITGAYMKQLKAQLLKSSLYSTTSFVQLLITTLCTGQTMPSQQIIALQLCIVSMHAHQLLLCGRAMES